MVLPDGPEGHPTRDQLYDQFLAELFEKRALNTQGFEEALKRRFWEEPPKLCSRSIGAWIDARLQQKGWTQQELASRLGVDPIAVAFWVGGGHIALPVLANVLLEFKSQWSQLPIPARHELALQAYLAALAFAREHLEPPAGPCALDRERFWCLFHLFSEPHWERAVRGGDPNCLRKEAERILKAAGRSLKKGSGYAADFDRLQGVASVDGLRRLVREWGMAWLVCVGFIPNRWAVQ
jgi:transcriptional regulator with XRE-family HTH domain